MSANFWFKFSQVVTLSNVLWVVCVFIAKSFITMENTTYLCALCFLPAATLAGIILALAGVFFWYLTIGLWNLESLDIDLSGQEEC